MNRWTHSHSHSHSYSNTHTHTRISINTTFRVCAVPPRDIHTSCRLCGVPPSDNHTSTCFRLFGVPPRHNYANLPCISIRIFKRTWGGRNYISAYFSMIDVGSSIPVYNCIILRNSSLFIARSNNFLAFSDRFSRFVRCASSEAPPPPLAPSPLASAT